MFWFFFRVHLCTFLLDTIFGFFRKWLEYRNHENDWHIPPVIEYPEYHDPEKILCNYLGPEWKLKYVIGKIGLLHSVLLSWLPKMRLVTRTGL